MAASASAGAFSVEVREITRFENQNLYHEVNLLHDSNTYLISHLPTDDWRSCTVVQWEAQGAILSDGHAE